MKVLILNKRNFDNMMEFSYINDDNVESQDAMFISICSPPDDNQPYISQLSQTSYFKREHPNVKILYFGDYSGEFAINNEHAFNLGHAKELYKFIKENENKSMAILHCGAGISRSGAVGTFIHDLYGTVTYEEFRRKNPQIQPNAHVLRLLRNEADKDKYKKV